MATDLADAKAQRRRRLKTADGTREELDRIGAARQEHEQEGKELQRATKVAVAAAKQHGISKVEVAERVGVHRTTVYRVYDQS